MSKYLWAAAAVALIYILFGDARADARVPRCNTHCQQEKQRQAEADAYREQQRQQNMMRQSEITDRQLREHRANNTPLPWSWTPTPLQRLDDLESRIEQLEQEKE